MEESLVSSINDIFPDSIVVFNIVKASFILFTLEKAWDNCFKD